METAHITKSVLNLKDMVSDVETVFLDLDGLVLGPTVVKVIFNSHVVFFIIDSSTYYYINGTLVPNCFECTSYIHKKIKCVCTVYNYVIHSSLLYSGIEPVSC